MEREIVRADLHTHNWFSKDSIASPELVVDQCKKVGITCLAVTNHNTIWGVNETREAAYAKGVNLAVITGEEITTGTVNTAGKKVELLAYFLQGIIPSNLSVKQTLQEIRDQGAIAGIPHPYEAWRHGVGKKLDDNIVQMAQELEVPLLWEIFNSRSRSINNSASGSYYLSHRDVLLRSLGSDAHHPHEIGRAQLVLEAWGGTTLEEQKSGFLESLKQPVGWVRDDDFRRTVGFRLACKLSRFNPFRHYPPGVQT